MNLNDIQKTAKTRPPKIVIYGPGGIGKSTFAASAPNPVGIQTEDGLYNIDSQAFPIAKSLGDVYEAINVLLNEQHDFKTVFIDSLDWLEPLIYAHVCAENNWDTLEKAGYNKGYTVAVEEWRQFLGGLDALRDERGMTVILISHDQVKRFESPLTDSYDRYELKLYQKTAALVQEWADVVCFAQYQTFTHTVTSGFNKKETKGVGNGVRMLYSEARPAFVAKNRLGLPAELPLSWAEFSKSLPVPF